MTHTALPTHTTQRVHTITSLMTRVKSALATGHVTPSNIRVAEAHLATIEREVAYARAELRAVKAREVV